MRYDVRSVQLGPEGVIVEYTDLYEDFRDNGIVGAHSMFVPGELPELADQFEALHVAVEELVRAAKVQFMDSAPSRPDDAVRLVDEDEAPGPYDNPLERG